MLEVTTRHDALVFGEGFSLRFERTLRIPDDGRTYPLPPGFGAFPLKRVADYAERVPPEWAEHGGVFLPMYQREAMWLRFSGRSWKPNAVKVGVGKINAVSGKPWSEELLPGENDYLVCPPQPWLDGINAGDGVVRQFIAMPLGMGYTVEGQITGEERFGGIQVVVYEPKPGQFPDEPPRPDFPSPSSRSQSLFFGAPAGGLQMGLGAGGRMKQKVYADPHNIDTWDPDNSGRVFIHIVNSMMYRDITGEEPPPTPISARSYVQMGLPWFDVYDEAMSYIQAPQVLGALKSIKELDQAQGFAPQQDDEPVDVALDEITQYKMGKEAVQDGEW